MNEPDGHRLPDTSKVCNGCGRELPATADYFAPTTGSWAAGTLRGTCRRCRNARDTEVRSEDRKLRQEATRAAGSAQWKPRVVGGDGPEGGFTEHPEDGYRFVCLPDSHGFLIDWQAAEAALAFVRYYRPVRVFLLGDHVDFDSISRFDGPNERLARAGEDVQECSKFLAKVRESAPEARIHYLKGNHEARYAKFLWKYPQMAALLKAQGMDLPVFLKLGEHRIEWEESGSLLVNDRLIVKHGHMVRQRSGYTATGELERNGVSGISGHTHRLGQVYKRNRTGILTWVESGCLCKYDPDYMEGQLSDWCQGLSFGTVSLRGHGFSVHTAPIVKGKVKALGHDIGA